MNHEEIKKAWECLTPDEQTKERMLQAILEKSAAMEQEESAKPNAIPWYVRLRVPMGISAAAMACAMIVTLAVDHPLLVNNGSSRQELLETMPVSGMHTTEPDVSAEAEQKPVTAETEMTQTEVSVQTTKPTTMQSVSSTTASLNNFLKSSTAATEAVTAPTPIVSAVVTSPTEVTVLSSITTEAPVTTLAEVEETTAVSEKTTETTAVLTTTTTTVTTTALPSLYGDMYDFNHVTWSGINYMTDYVTVPLSDLVNYLGSGVAVGDTVSGSYTILLYEIDGMPIEKGFAVHYAGQDAFYLFYCVD